MRATQIYFHGLAESLSQMVWTVDTSGRLSYGNSAWHALTAIAEGNPFVESYLPAIHPEDKPRWRNVWNEAVTTGEPYVVERRFRCAAESNYVRQLEWGKPIRNAAGNTGAWVIIATDPDDRERLMALQQRSLERKDKVLALVAHELRGPLAPIYSALKLLEGHSNDVELVNRSRSTIERQVAQLVRLVDDLFSVVGSSNAQLAIRRDSVNLKCVIASAIERARPMMVERDQKLTVVASADEAIVDGDEGRLLQVFGNLLENAAKYTGTGGQIWIDLERHQGWLQVRVRDSGIGISREMLPRVFDPYFRAERGSVSSNGGLGLGLALARELVELHGGSVSAYSDGPEQGSEFAVRLPAIREPQHSVGLSREANVCWQSPPA